MNKPESTMTITSNEAKKRADKALQDADAKELFALFEQAVQNEKNAMTALDAIVNHYAGSKDSPRMPTMDAIGSMERVALAAIALAEKVSDTKRGGGQ